MLRVDEGNGRGRYTAAWWEWDCGAREATEVVIGVKEKVDKHEVGNVTGGERRERKKRNVDKGGVKTGRTAFARGDKTGRMNGFTEDGDDDGFGHTIEEAQGPIEEAEMAIEESSHEEGEEGHSPMADTRMEEAQIDETQVESQMDDVASGNEM
jgi:hypothetical protein